MVLRELHARILAVDAAAAGEEDLQNPVQPHGLEHDLRQCGARMKIDVRLAGRPGDVGIGRQVIDDIGSLHAPPQKIRVPDVPLDEGELRGSEAARQEPSLTR